MTIIIAAKDGRKESFSTENPTSLKYTLVRLGYSILSVNGGTSYAS
jgi:hypothetical protein